MILGEPELRHWMNTQGPIRILHVDGDSFFASCEIALNPRLQGRRVWVGGGRRGDGIVIAANRAAKKFGARCGRENFADHLRQQRKILCHLTLP